MLMVMTWMTSQWLLTRMIDKESRVLENAAAVAFVYVRTPYGGVWVSRMLKQKWGREGETKCYIYKQSESHFEVRLTRKEKYLVNTINVAFGVQSWSSSLLKSFPYFADVDYVDLIILGRFNPTLLTILCLPSLPYLSQSGNESRVFLFDVSHEDSCSPQDQPCLLIPLRVCPRHLRDIIILNPVMYVCCALNLIWNMQNGCPRCNPVPPPPKCHFQGWRCSSIVSLSKCIHRRWTQSKKHLVTSYTISWSLWWKTCPLLFWSWLNLDVC